MRLNQTGSDFQVGIDVTRIDPGGNAVRSGTEARMFFFHLAVMIFDAIVGDDFLADHLNHFRALVGTVQARRIENDNLPARDTGQFESAQNGRQNEFYWERAE